MKIDLKRNKGKQPLLLSECLAIGQLLAILYSIRFILIYSFYFGTKEKVQKYEWETEKGGEKQKGGLKY